MGHGKYVRKRCRLSEMRIYERLKWSIYKAKNAHHAHRKVVRKFLEGIERFWYNI